MTERVSIPVGTAVFLAAALTVPLALLACGCGDSGGYYEQAPRQKSRPYPSAQMERAKELKERGDTLFAQALGAPTQEDKNKLAGEARDEYYHPAQDIVNRLMDEYPEYESSFDSFGQQLSRKISDANKIIGF